MRSTDLVVIEETRKFVEKMFHKDNLVFIECLVKYPGPRSLMCVAYATLVVNKLIQRIEDIPPDEKSKLKYYTLEYSNGRLNKEENVKLAKALFTLEYFL